MNKPLSIPTRRRRLRSFREVTSGVGKQRLHKRVPLKEAKNLTERQTEPRNAAVTRKPGSTYVQRLRRYRDVKNQRAPTFAESDSPSDEDRSLVYYVTAVPMDASPDEKMDALAELGDVITDVDDADVFVTAMWLE
jgi:hypothetical protein